MYCLSVNVWTVGSPACPATARQQPWESEPERTAAPLERCPALRAQPCNGSRGGVSADGRRGSACTVQAGAGGRGGNLRRGMLCSPLVQLTRRSNSSNSSLNSADSAGEPTTELVSSAWPALWGTSLAGGKQSLCPSRQVSTEGNGCAGQQACAVHVKAKPEMGKQRVAAVRARSLADTSKKRRVSQTRAALAGGSDNVPQK